MSDEEWKEVIDDGQISWWHDKLGGIVKSGNKYVAEAPFVRIVKLGPFSTLEEAQEAISNPQVVHNAFDQAVAVVNEGLTKKE